MVWPLLVRAVRFYQHFWLENATAVSLPPTFSPEYEAVPGPNANYDLALLRWGLRTALQLNAQFGPSSTTTVLGRFQVALPKLE